MDCMKPLDFGSFDMYPGERLYVELDFSENLEARWQSNKLYRAGEVVRPGNGFAFRAELDFTSGTRAPRWTVQAGSRVPDGSGAWVAFAANFEGVDVINQVTPTLPFGLVIDGSPTWEGSRVTLPLTGGVDGNVYECMVEIGTVSGQAIVGMFACDVSTKRNRCA